MHKTLAVLGTSLLLASAMPSPAPIFYWEVPLSGAQETTGGDPDGSGLALLWFNSADNSVTWDITVANIAPFTLDHIHRAPAGVNGQVRIDFSSSLSGGPLVDADVALLLAEPDQYYVNVHNADFPGGAVRGQLSATPTAVIPEASSWLAMAGVAGIAAAHQLRRRRAVVARDTAA